jgi:hypothetical protein
MSLTALMSKQRKMRVLTLRIEGSTGTPSLEGPSKLEASITDNGVGHYTVTFDKAFTQAPICVANAEAVDKCVTLVPAAASVVVKVNDIDETPALSDGDVQLLIIGSDASGFYEA